MITLFILSGVVLLYFGAEIMVRGAHRSSIRLGMTPLVAGLTVVSLSTSMPEAVSSFVAQVFGDYGTIAIGNVIGSNIANIGLVLGISALVRPLQVTRFIRWREMPIMIIALAVLMVTMAFQPIGRWAGLVLVILLVAYLIFQVIIGKREHVEAEDAPHFKRGTLPALTDLFLIFGGLIGLVAGGYLLIEGSISLARTFGIPQRVIGITIVAVGSSLPELAASLVANLRRHDDIAVGNVIGSNVFNALFVVGLVALVAPITFDPKLLHFDALVMAFFSLFLWILLTLQKKLGRLSGAILLILYATYITYIL